MAADRKRGNCMALGIGSLKEMRLNSITTYLDGISQPNITLKVHSTLMSNWNFLILNYTMLGNISSTF
jgi:hypothetical protein